MPTTYKIQIAFAALFLAFWKCSFAQSTEHKIDSFARSQVCSQAAKEYMKRPEWEDFRDYYTLSYTSHYNNKLNKCFINVRRIQLIKDKNEIFEMNHIYDAFEGRIVGGKILTKKPIGAAPKVISMVLLKGDRFIRDPAESEAVLTWFDSLMED